MLAIVTGRTYRSSIIPLSLLNDYCILPIYAIYGIIYVLALMNVRL